ncbi:MAG TPA: hypothetical protein VFN05_08705 [Actinomycetes bacterium]|nr:hypothetical protein [Actinomycetes bacterium]
MAKAVLELEGGLLPLHFHPFPDEWGTPPADVNDRRAWVVGNIWAGEARAAGASMSLAAAGGLRSAVGRQALGPGAARLNDEHRLRMVQVRAHGPCP